MAKIIIIIVFMTNLILTSCNNIPDRVSKVVEKKRQFNEVNFVDIFQNNLIKDNSQQITISQFPPVYIGKLKNRIKLNYIIEKIGNRTEEWDKYSLPSVSSITISIDTTRNIPSTTDVFPLYKLGGNVENKNISAYPVFIQNISIDTVQIGFGDIIPMVIEAKDKKGIWRPIQKRFRYDCATGLTSFFLAPNQISISTMKQFKGTFKTELRIVYLAKKKIYSNTITGNIDPKQFE
jgi:hypothetical protein